MYVLASVSVLLGTTSLSVLPLRIIAVEPDCVVMSRRFSHEVWTWKSAWISSKVSEYVLCLSRRKPLTSVCNSLASMSIEKYVLRKMASLYTIECPLVSLCRIHFVFK